MEPELDPKKSPDEALDEARREAAGKKIEDQGEEGGLTEATHGHGSGAPKDPEAPPPPD